MTSPRGHSRGGAVAVAVHAAEPASPLAAALVAAATLDGDLPDLLRAVLDSTSDIVYVKSVAGPLLFANRAMGVFFGCPAADLIGKAERDLFPPDVAAALEADNLAALGETGLRETEERVVRPDGTEAWTQTTKGRIQDASGRVVGMFGVVRDITAPKLAERTAAEQASRYRAEIGRAHV